MTSKDLRLGVNNMVYVESVTEVEVDSSDEALDLFLKGYLCKFFIFLQVNAFCFAVTCFFFFSEI